MTREALLEFLKRMLEKGSSEKSMESLKQLKKILELQDAGIEMITLVEKTLESIPEAKDAAKKDSFSEDELRIAFRRAEERKRREAEAAQMGRC